jgi:hypothetical protein
MITHSFWHTPFRLGWMLKTALLQTGRHADVLYPLFAIVLISGFLSPSLAQLESGTSAVMLWQGLSIVLTFTLMTGWMQTMNARTWLMMLDEAKQQPLLLLDGVSMPSPLPLKESSSETTAWMTPVQRHAEDTVAVQASAKTDRPCLLRPTLTPFFQGIGRFATRSLVVNGVQTLVFAMAILLPFFVIYKLYGLPTLLGELTPERLNAFASMSSAEIKALILKQPPEQLQLISTWMMGLFIAMIQALLVFLLTILWWPTLLVSDTSVGEAFKLQLRYFKHDYIRALLVASSQVGLLGLFILLPATSSPSLWLNIVMQVGLFFGFVFSTHFAFIYVYSLLRPAFIPKHIQSELLKKKGTTLSAVV